MRYELDDHGPPKPMLPNLFPSHFPCLPGNAAVALLRRLPCPNRLRSATQCSWLGKGLWERLRRATRVCCAGPGVGPRAVEVKPLSTTYGHVPNAPMSATNSAHSKNRFCASPLPISLAPCSPLSRTLRAASGGGKRHP
jgi:hypothetical protein